MTLTLRKKTLTIVTLTLIALVAILFFVVREIVLDRFSGLERDDVRENVTRVSEALDNELGQISINAQDNVLPGTTPERMKEIFENYERTVTPQGLSGRVDLLVNRLGGMNVALLTDASGQIIWGWGYNEDTQEIGFVPATLKDLLKEPNSPLINPPEDATGTQGIILLPDGPMLVVSESFQGKSSQRSGSLLMGKFIQDQEVEALEELTRLSLTVDRLDDDEVPSADFSKARSSVSDDRPIFIETLDDPSVVGEIAGYTVVNDVFGNPGLMIRVDIPRDIRAEGVNSVRALLVALVIVGVVLVVLIALLLDRLVLSRMARLSSQVSSINMASDLLERVSLPGNDEISNLGSAINGMLGEIQTERGKSDDLLLNVLPQSIADRLKQGESTIAENYPEVSVLFADVCDFTMLSQQIAPSDLVELLNKLFSRFDRLSEQYQVEKIKAIGDAYMAVGGLPEPKEDHAEAIADMALSMQEEIQRFNPENNTSLRIRVGINSGPVVAGVIGEKKFIYDLWGDTVNTASRMESNGIEGDIQVTEDTYHRLKDKFLLEERGVIDVKGKGQMLTYFLKSRVVPADQVSEPV